MGFTPENKKRYLYHKYFFVLTTEDFKKFPSTRYQGSKRKILPWIYSNLKELRFNTVLDGCGGTGSVSYLFKKMNKSVTYNDNLKFNYIIGKALIENQSVRLTDEDVCNLVRFNGDGPSLISRLFKDIYYLDQENYWLDNMGYSILNMNHYTGQILDYKKSIAYYALFQASLAKRPFNLFHRKNLNLRTADVKRKFGNKATWEKDFQESFKGFVSELNSLVFDSGRPCVSLNQSIFDIEKTDYDLVYLDIPYVNKGGSNETSNYLKCYHFLEGLVNYEEWENMIDHNSSNMRILGSQKDEFFNKDSIYESIENLIYKFRQSKIVFSYKKGGIPSIDFIVKVMKKYKRNVYTRSRFYSYALSKSKSANVDSKEVLIIEC